MEALARVRQRLSREDRPSVHNRYIATIVSVKPQAPTLAHSSRPRVLPYLAVPTNFKFSFFKNVVRAPPAYVGVAVGLGARCKRTLDGG